MSAFTQSGHWISSKSVKSNVRFRPEADEGPLLRAANAHFLHGQTIRIAVGTKHSAIATERFEQLTTIFAFAEELSRVRWHRFSPGAPAFWASEC
jgi:hypothetical protein